MTDRMSASEYNKTRRAKPVDREGPIQIEIVEWLRSALPAGTIVHHCRNEINRSGWSIAKEQAKATKMGAVRGFPDLVVLPNAETGPMFFEVKAPKGYPTPAQKAVHAELTRLGYHVAVVRSVGDVRDHLRLWGVSFVEVIEHRGVVR